MSIARIQIDCGLLEGETLAEVLMKIGDQVMEILDNHAEDEPCVRYLHIEGYQFADEDYEVKFDPEEEAMLDELPAFFADPSNWN